MGPIDPWKRSVKWARYTGAGGCPIPRLHIEVAERSAGGPSVCSPRRIRPHLHSVWPLQGSRCRPRQQECLSKALPIASHAHGPFATHGLSTARKTALRASHALGAFVPPIDLVAKKHPWGNSYTPPPGWMACMAAQTPPQSAAARSVRIWSNGLVPCNPMHAMVPANPPTPAPAIGSAPSMPSAAQVAPLYTAMKVPNPPAWDLHSCHSRSLGASLRATSNVHSVPTCHDAAGASTAMSARSTRHAPGATSADVPPRPRADAPPRRAGTRPPPARRMEDVCRSPPCLFVRGKSRSSYEFASRMAMCAGMAQREGFQTMERSWKVPPPVWEAASQGVGSNRGADIHGSIFALGAMS